MADKLVATQPRQGLDMHDITTPAGRAPTTFRWPARPRLTPLFLVTVVIPTLLALAYYGLVASDVYVSESRFVVRSPQKQQSTGLNALLQGTGIGTTADDSYPIVDFMLSRDALAQLDRELGLRERFGDKHADFLSRFPGLLQDDSFETLHRYYQRRVSAGFDPATSISTLRVSAFAAEDAHRINERLLAMSEALVNRINERARMDTIRYAEAEASEAARKAREAALALSSYRSEQAVFDPEKQSALQFQQVSKLQDELIAAKTQLAQVRAFTPDNPQGASLAKRIETLSREIASESAKITGNGRSLTSKAAEYERLALDRALADRLLATALASLETARNDAQRKQLYLERVVQPNLPDVAVEPRRVRSVLMVLLMGLLTWGIASLLVASVREHHD